MVINSGEGRANKKLSILITGASTGIGWDCSLELAKMGWRVFATVRKEADGKKLVDASSGEVTPVIMDISDYESVKKGALIIEEKLAGDGLDALFNNAGISVQGPMEIIPVKMFEEQMRVNVFGHFYVTQVFLPMIRRVKGRILFMSSESGRITIPLVGPYSASKFALESMANAFRIELLPSGIGVSLIEAATIKTPMWDKIDITTEKMIAMLPQQARELYKTELHTLLVFPKKQAQMGIPMKKVTRAVIRALSVRRPKARYVVGWEAWLFIILHKVFPTRLVDWVSSKALIYLGK
jgi:NAD(P)-dependent dehydrogenase (short-subunit alcohol dehydrogenase family)